jgi:predicted component of type VI protein secretion system
MRTGNAMKLTLPIIALLCLLAGCNPTVKVEAPEKPIEINLNVKIEHNIRLQVDKELEGLFAEESGVF